MTPETFPIALSAKIAAAAMLVVLPLGTALAWIQARLDYAGRRAVDAIILLPLVLPPSVTGYALVVLFGRHGVLGQGLEAALGARLIFTQGAAVMAAVVVALPLYVKTAEPAIEAVPRELERVARSLGLRPSQVALRVTLPGAWRGLLAASVLAFARAIGEFGATLMFAGNQPGRTNTMPLEIFAAYQAGDDRRALLYVATLTAISIAVVWTASRLGARRAAELGA